MNKTEYYKYMFFGGANFNIGAGLLFSIVPLFADGFLPFFGIENPPSLIFVQMLAGVIIGFAVGYLIVMNKLEKGKYLAISGAVARLLAFLLVLIYTIIGHCNWIFLLLVSPDLILGVMYLEFYFRYDKIRRSIFNYE